MSLLPIEVFAQIAFHLPGEDYTRLSSLNKNLRENLPLYRTSSLPFNMIELQQEAYDSLYQSKRLQIFFQRIPHTGSSIVLLNYIAHELEINNGKQILVSCASVEYDKWRKRLQKHFTSFISIPKYKTSSRIPMARIILTKRKYKEILFKVIEPSLLLLLQRYNDDTVLYPNLRVKCVESSCRLEPSYLYAGAERIVKRTILPFPSYPQEFINGMDQIKHKKVTMIGPTLPFVRWFKKTFSYVIFRGDQPEQVKAFEQCDKEAILLYNEDFIWKKTPVLTGPVISVNAFDMNSFNHPIHMLPVYHTLFISKGITHLYHLNWFYRILWNFIVHETNDIHRILLYDIAHRLFMITRNLQLYSRVQLAIKANNFLRMDVHSLLEKETFKKLYSHYYSLLNNSFCPNVILETLMTKRTQY